MKRVFKNFTVVAATETELTVRMNSGETYCLWRGLDPDYQRLLKLLIDDEFFRTPRKAGELARSEDSGRLVPVRLTRYDLGSLTKAGW